MAWENDCCWRSLVRKKEELLTLDFFIEHTKASIGKIDHKNLFTVFFITSGIYIFLENQINIGYILD